MWFFALAGSAVVPSLLLFWYIHSRDVHPEPRGMLLATFALGAATAVPVIVVVTALSAVVPAPVETWPRAAWQAFLQAAIPEEAFKFVVLMAFCYRSRHFDEPFDGVVYGATASLGFATLENILYVSQGGLGVAVLRALTAVPGHAFTGVVMGYFVGRAKFAQSGRGWLATQGLVYATVLHGLYDLFLLTHTTWFLLSAPVLLVEVLWGVVLIRRMRVDGFIPPLPAGGAGGLAEMGMQGPWPPPLAGAVPPPGDLAAGAPVYTPTGTLAGRALSSGERPGSAAPGPWVHTPDGRVAGRAVGMAGPVPAGPPLGVPAAAPVRSSTVRLGRLLSGALLASVCALFALAGVGGLLVEEGAELPVAVGLLVGGLGGLVGGVLLFASGIAPLGRAPARP